MMSGRGGVSRVPATGHSLHSEPRGGARPPGRILCYLARVSRVLIVANDVVARRMAGPGIRCWELGRALAADGHQVTLVGVGATDLESSGLTVVAEPGPAALEKLAGSQDVILLEGLSLVRYPALARAQVPLVVDLYDPFPIALLGQEEHRELGDREREDSQIRGAVRDLLHLGDYFICASETQRDLWQGSLLAEGRLNPLNWTRDPTFRQLIDVVPFGLPAAPLLERAPGPRFPLPGIGRRDLVLLWGGGIYNWFDPLTLIEAVGRLQDLEPAVKLVFMSTTHPNAGIPPKMWMTGRARELADELGLTGQRVFFNSDWVPYEDRAKWLSAADCGVSTHFENAETHFAFRTRILDYLWAGLPIICTKGDHFAQLVERRQLGWTVPARDSAALEAAIRELAADPDRRQQISKRVKDEAEQLTWGQTAAPLRAFAAAPWRAADGPRSHQQPPAPAPSPWRLTTAEGLSLIRRGALAWRREGTRATWRRAVNWWARRRVR